MLHRIAMTNYERFNDITTDPRGRVFAGTMKCSLADGTLYRIERGREPMVVLSGIGISNGMTFSLDERTFFHTDSVMRRITAFDYDAATGDIANARLFYQGAERDGCPDGITMDRDGCIWAACWGASQVIRLDGRGAIVERVPIPANQPSSVAFGGGEMNRLFVTTACEGGVDLVRGLDGDGCFLGGYVYAFSTETAGRLEWEADLG
jgi:sugar lactone lactonase YvrE